MSKHGFMKFHRADGDTAQPKLKPETNITNIGSFSNNLHDGTHLCRRCKEYTLFSGKICRECGFETKVELK